MNEEPNESDPSYLMIVPAIPSSARIIADFVHAATLLGLNVATRDIKNGEITTHIRAAAW